MKYIYIQAGDNGCNYVINWATCLDPWRGEQAAGPGPRPHLNSNILIIPGHHHPFHNNNNNTLDINISRSLLEV